MKTRTHALLPLGMVAALGLGTPQAQAEALLKPYVLASASKAETVKQALTSNGFTIAGSYAPYDGTQIIIATHDTLKKSAAASKFGGYGAAVRVAVTEVAGQPQTSYTNPEYMKEVLVSGNKAYILHGKFRIAQSFPDLGMGSFMTISAAPDAIENSLKAVIQ